MDEMNEINAELEEENRRLREMLYCVKKGIPEEYREDMALLARSRARAEGSDFESAADAVAQRYAGIFPRRSGTAMGRMNNDDSALRRAFGLDMKGE